MAHEKTNPELMIRDYQLVMETGEKCFNRMYSTLNFLIIYYGAVLYVGLQSAMLPDRLLIFLYALPFPTYLLGLFYCYNLVSLMRSTLYLTRLENAMHAVPDGPMPADVFRWSDFCNRHSSRRTLVYGTGLMAFVLAPIILFVWTCNVIGLQVSGMLETLGFIVFPLSAYAAFLLFTGLILWKAWPIYKEIKSLSRSEEAPAAAAPPENK